MRGSQPPLCNSHLGRAGRKPGSAVTPEQVEQLETLLSSGNYVRVACRVAGVSYSALKDWLARGAQGDEAYVELAARLHAAKGRGIARNVGIIAKAATEGDWKAAAWILEHGEDGESWMRPERGTRPPDAGPGPPRSVEPQQVEGLAALPGLPDELAQRREARR